MKTSKLAVTILCGLTALCLMLPLARSQSAAPPPNTILKELKGEKLNGEGSDASTLPPFNPSTLPPTSPGKVDEKAPAHFRAGDFDLSLYGKGSIDIRSRSKQDLDYGGGIGGTYWLTRGLGLGGLAELGDFNHSVIDQASGRITVRAPLWDTIAPYGFADGGYDFERERWLVEAGGGGELRFAAGWGLFLEAGLGTSTRGEAYGVARAGVRLTAF